MTAALAGSALKALGGKWLTGQGALPLQQVARVFLRYRPDLGDDGPCLVLLGATGEQQLLRAIFHDDVVAERWRRTLWWLVRPQAVPPTKERLEALGETF